MSLSQAMQAAQERARARREAAAAAVLGRGSLPVARRLNLDEQQLMHERLARQEERGNAFGIRTQQEREGRENQRIQDLQPASIGKTHKARRGKTHKARRGKSRKARRGKSRKARRGKSRKARRGKSRKARRGKSRKARRGSKSRK